MKKYFVEVTSGTSRARQKTSHCNRFQIQKMDERHLYINYFGKQKRVEPQKNMLYTNSNGSPVDFGDVKKELVTEGYDTGPEEQGYRTFPADSILEQYGWKGSSEGPLFKEYESDSFQAYQIRINKENMEWDIIEDGRPRFVRGKGVGIYPLVDFLKKKNWIET